MKTTIGSTCDVRWDIQGLALATESRLTTLVRLAMAAYLGLVMPTERLEQKKKLEEKKFAYKVLKARMIKKIGAVKTAKFIAKNTDPDLAFTLKSLEATQRELDNRIKRPVRKERLWLEYLKDVRGIGEILTGQIIAMIDAKKTHHVSSIWRFAGLHPAGKHREKGVKTDYNPKVKTLMYKVGDCFIKTRSQYRYFYDRAKSIEAVKLESQIKEAVRLGRVEIKKPKPGEKGSMQTWYLLVTHPDRGPENVSRVLHGMEKTVVHLRAMTKMLKVFSAHLIIKMREIEGMPFDSPYPGAELGHTLVTWEEMKRWKK